MIKRPRKDRYVTSGSDSKLIAMFWWIGESFIGVEDAVQGPSTVLKGNKWVINMSPSEAWRQAAPKEILNSINWDACPRGAIQFSDKLNKFIVSGDRKLVDDLKMQKNIMFRYGLPDDTKFEVDPTCESTMEV